MDGFARWLVRHPGLVLAANLLVTLVLGVSASKLRIESQLENVLPSGDPAVAYYAQVRALFGSDDVAVVGVRADDLFALPTIEKIDRVTTALAKVEGIEKVLSITNTVDPAANVFNPPRLLPRMPPTPDDIEALKHKLATTPLYRQNLVAPDLRGAAINVFMKPLSDAQYSDLDVDGKIREVLARESGPERFFFTGGSHLKQEAVRLMRADLFRFTPLAVALVLVVLWLAFLTKRGVMLPLISVVVAIVWTLGIMVLAGRSITIGTSVLPALLMVVGASYAIHVMSRYYEQVDAGAPSGEVVVRAFLRVWLPLSISALITGIGFGSLMVNRIPAIWELGCFAVVGVVCLTITSLTLLPAALAILPIELRTARAGKVAPSLVKFLARLARVAYRQRQAILITSALLGLVSLLGMRLIRVDADFLYYFSPRSEVRQDNETINREIVGSNPFYLVIEGTEAGLLKRWDVLKRIKELQQFIQTLPGITSSLSLVDYLELLETGLNKVGEQDLEIDDQGNLVPAKAKTFWEDPKNLEPLLKIVTTSPETFKGVVTADFGKSSVLVRTNLSGSHVIEETLQKIRDYIGTHMPADMPVRLTGNLVLLTGTTSDIVAGQVQSLGLALGIIFIVMSLMFLSVRIGFLAILPNLLPIAVFFGVMGFLGIRLNLGTSLIAAIALGIVVDSTVHYMARLNLELQGETDQQAAITRALRTVGVPIVFTTVALALGFLTFAFSSFVPIQNFGILSGVTMAASLGANLVLLPALLATTKIITLWDLVGVKLGKDPARTIPLFAGLRPAQARVVVLMGEVKRYEPGETIVRQGEQGEEMYVILQGKTEAWVHNEQTRKCVNEMRRGDVFGEMGLVRHTERSADVVAAESVEVLALNERFLARIQRRYPRIASRVFLNLTRILSDRLERMNQFVSAQAR
jgi:hypothetical protein